MFETYGWVAFARLAYFARGIPPFQMAADAKKLARLAQFLKYSNTKACNIFFFELRGLRGEYPLVLAPPR